MTDYEATKLVQSARQAAFPWMGASRKVRRRKEYVQTDSERQIRKCLSCRLKNCVNCYDNMEKIVSNACERGIKQSEFCRLFGIGKTKFFELKKAIAQ